MMEVGYLEGSALGGAFGLKGNLSLRDPMKYEAELSATQVDLAEVSRVLAMMRDDGKPRVSGRAVARVAGQGQLEGSDGDALASIRASGSVHVTDGDFWSSKLLDRLLSHVRIARDALTAGEAAAVFDIRDRKIQLHQAAISSTALGVQGSGTIGLDGVLDLNMIVAPLGDWRHRIKESGIPLVSNVAGEIVGVIQKLVNTATSQRFVRPRRTNWWRRSKERAAGSLRQAQTPRRQRAEANSPTQLLSCHFALEALDHVQQSVQVKRLEKDTYIRSPTRSAKAARVVRAVGQDRDDPGLYCRLKITEAIDKLGRVGRPFGIHHDQVGAIALAQQLHGFIGRSAIADVMPKLTEKSCGRRSI
jgi:hypothetical protein